MKTDFQALATKLIYDVFGSISQTLIIRRPLYINYDEETGTQMMSHDDYTIQAVIGPWINKNEAAATSAAIRTDDLSAIISKSTLTITPEVSYDIAITADGTEWNIAYSATDEAEATLTLRLSKGLEE